ncbi:MAG TPA: hypothetical protein VFO85_11010, partial [Vicinamibacteria bacterium]|nr:hypothetical protein [Vicinamibacteria bacterium]
AVAATGEGVMDAFVAAVQQMLASIAVKYNLREKGLDPAVVPGIVSEAFTNVLREAARGTAAGGGAPLPPRILVTDTRPAAAEAPTQPDELLSRAIQSNVALAEALSGVVREMNLGLAAILSHAELLLMYKEGAKEKREASARSIQEEASRLRTVVTQLNRAALHPMPSGDLIAPVPPAAPAADGPATMPGPAAAPPAPPPSTFDALLRTVLDRVSGQKAEALAIELKVAPGLASPTCPPEELERTLSALFSGVTAGAPPRSALSVQAERKPVVLRGRDGEQRRDFLLVALRQAGGPSTDEQARIAAGDPALYGGSARRLREMGAFVRFAPADGGVEMRVFLP